MRFPVQHPRGLFRRATAREDAASGLVLGVESVPDGLASGLLAGVNPVAGLYAYLFGMVGGALFTSTNLMAIQGTGAMAMVVSDVDLASREDPLRTLYTLAMLTGVVMIAAGVLRLGSFLRFVSTSVMTGFTTAVGVNIVLGQLDNFTGYSAEGGNRVTRVLDLVLHVWEVDRPTVAVGAVTIALIVWLQRTRLGALGLVVAVFVGSAVASVLGALDHEVALVRDIATVPRSLPAPMLPVLSDIPFLLVPAVSLAFVGLVQGAGVSAAHPNPDGTPQDTSQDFVAQGAGNIVAGVFQGTPVGASSSASSLLVTAGARTRQAAFVAAVVMAIVVLVFGAVIEQVAMSSLAALLIVVGVGTIRPSRIRAVAMTGPVSLTVMTITFVLTLIVPLQFAVLVGVGISVILFVIQQSSRLSTRRLVFHDDGRIEEAVPPGDVPPGEVVVLQPYGALFFATASKLIDQMPNVTPESRGSVVVVRIRGADDAGVTVLDALAAYARELRAVDSKLVLVSDSDRVVRQIAATRADQVIGSENVYRSTAFVGEAVRHAHDDAVAWIGERDA